MNFGPKTTEEVSFTIMDKAHDLGINFFDTTNVYGWKVGEGWTAPIIGPRTLEQLMESLRALKIKFSKVDMEKLDEIWPGPKGESPEAFAW